MFPRRGVARDILSKDQRQAVIADYLAGTKYRDLASKYGVTDSAIWAILDRAGVARRRRHVSDDDLFYAEQFCAAARRPKIIEGLCKPDRARKVHPLNEHAFDVMTPESAYWAGLLMADGSIAGAEQLVLQLSDPDHEHVDRFKAFVGYSGAMTIIQPGFNSQGWTRRLAHRVSIRSDRLNEALAHYGVVRGKTYHGDAGIARLHPDFWRGVIDGDGSISRSGAALTGSPHLIAQFSAFVRTLLPGCHVGLSIHGVVHTAHINGRASIVLLRMLYHDSLALPRKRALALDLLSRKASYIF